jgi:hypothetical protein
MPLPVLSMSRTWSVFATCSRRSGTETGWLITWRHVRYRGTLPGHMAYVLDSGEDRMLFCGDLIHVPAAQFAWPELTWAYDLDPSIARATRINLLREASRHRPGWRVRTWRSQA